MASNTSFDPFSQTLTLIMGNGEALNITIPKVNDFYLYSVQICINYGAQLGATLIILIVLALLTKPDKRTSPIFILNSLSLILNFIRNLLQCLFFTGPFSELYAFFAADFSRVPGSAYATSITATIFTLLLLICVETSLLLQAQVVCITMRKHHRLLIFGISIATAVQAVAFRFAVCIENSRAILDLESAIPLDWLTSSSAIAVTVSICWFCAVFVFKLGHSIYQRRQMGLRRFGPMQVIFIMGCQTLIIPAIFSILQYWTTSLPAMQSNVLTLVAIFLPLSSLWASASLHHTTHNNADNANNNHHSPSTPPHPPHHPRNPFASFVSTMLEKRKSSSNNSTGGGRSVPLSTDSSATTVRSS